MAQTTKLLLQPGETRLLTLGGKGRPVTGRIVVKGYDRSIDWRADLHMLETLVPNPPELPDFLEHSRQYYRETARAASTDEEKAAARASFDRQQQELIQKTKAFYASDAAWEYQFAKKRYALNFAQDGSFRIEDVPGGKYTLKVELREGSGEGPSRYSAPRIGGVEKEIEVPASPGGRSDERFDLGTIEIQARQVVKTGKAAALGKKPE
jgi:hypothetical protein